jgi:hypothetical protein
VKPVNLGIARLMLDEILIGPKSSLEEFAVRAQAHKPQGLVIRSFVDEKQIGFEMALAMAGIVTRQRMIVKSCWQGLVSGQ